MTLPEILITGFPDSGTSFVGELVASLGFHLGSKKNLKSADCHNRWGYWEHTAISVRIRARHHGPLRMIPRDLLPDQPYNFKFSPEIASEAAQDRVEVYKDCSLPWTYKLLNPEAKIILIKRQPREMHGSNGLGHLGYEYDYTDLLLAWGRYHDVAVTMCNERDHLIVWYHEFRENFESSTQAVCDFLEVEYREDLAELFRPRRKS